MSIKASKTNLKARLSVIIVSGSTEEAASIGRELRRARYDVATRRVDALTKLREAIEEGDWEIVLFDASSSSLEVEVVLGLLRHMNGAGFNGASEIEMPCIVLADEVDVETAVTLLRQGAGDCIAKTEMERLGPAIEREVREARARREATGKLPTISPAVQSSSSPQDSSTLSSSGRRDEGENVDESARENQAARGSQVQAAEGVLAKAPADESSSNRSATAPLNGDALNADALNGDALNGDALNADAAPSETVFQNNLGASKRASDVRASDIRDSDIRVAGAGVSGLDEKNESGNACGELTKLLLSLPQMAGNGSDPALVAHVLSVHLGALLPFDSVGISLYHLEPPRGSIDFASDGRNAGQGNSARRMSTHAAPGRNGVNGNGANGTNENGSSGAKDNGVARRAPEIGEDRHATTAWAASAFSADALEALKARGETPGVAAPSAQGVPRTMLNVPLIAEGHQIGALHFAADAPDAFDSQHARLAQSVADGVALGLWQARQLSQARLAEEKYRHLFNNLDVILWEADPSDLRFTFVNPRAEAWLGYPIARWLDDADFWQTLLHPDDRERVLKELRQVARDGGDLRHEFSVLADDGRVLCLRNLLSVEVENGAPVRMDGIMLDVSERKQSEAALRESLAILKATQEAAADGVFLIDGQGHVVSFNKRFIEMWRIPTELLENLRARQQLMAFVLSNLKDPEEFIEKINFVYENPLVSSRDEIYLNDGRVFSCYAAPALSPEGKSYGWVWSFSDITEHKRYELELARQASHDSLTGLPNRVLFMDRLKRAVSRLGHDNTMTALLFLDLDRFKVINDSLGHEHGDRLLIEMAHRLRACIRPGDTAARFGGDEFTILLESISSVNEATRVAERIEDYLQTPFALGGHDIFSTASIGIVISTSGEDQADVLLRHADVAMYRAKSRGGSQYEIFDVKMSSLALDRLQLEIDLRQALRRQQLLVHYQPQVASRGGRIVGVEALVRWQHPVRGLIGPVEFIPIAEETGLILSIGPWVLRQACEQAKRWQTEIPTDVPLEISVNLSAKQFQQPGLVEDIARVLEETGLEPRTLVLEITESVVMKDEQATQSQLKALKKLGVQLAIDDFGTGYSSLSYLERFDLDTIKIDRSFVNRIGDKGENTAIVRAVSTLGQALGVKITAEGVETEAQLLQLRAMGCDLHQGFFFAKPLSVDATTTLLKENPMW